MTRYRAAQASLAARLLPIFLFAAAAAAAEAPELNPRAYAPMATGGNVMMLSYARSSGGVLFDPSLPVDDVHATIGRDDLEARRPSVSYRTRSLSAMTKYRIGVGISSRPSDPQD